MMGQQGEMMMKDMIMANNQHSNSSGDQALPQHQRHQVQNSTSANNSSMSTLSMESGSNYLKAGWQGQESISATVLVQLDGEIAEGGQIIVMVVPFLYH